MALKKRKLTLAMVREVLKAHATQGPMTNEELADALGCSVVTVQKHLYQWVQMAGGVRSVRRGARKFVGWSYMPVEQFGDYEPVTRSVEELEEWAAELEGELERVLPGRVAALWSAHERRMWPKSAERPAQVAVDEAAAAADEVVEDVLAAGTPSGGADLEGVADDAGLPGDAGLEPRSQSEDSVG